MLGFTCRHVTSQKQQSGDVVYGWAWRRSSPIEFVYSNSIQGFNIRSTLLVLLLLGSIICRHVPYTGVRKLVVHTTLQPTKTCPVALASPLIHYTVQKCTYRLNTPLRTVINEARRPAKDTEPSRRSDPVLVLRPVSISIGRVVHWYA